MKRILITGALVFAAISANGQEKRMAVTNLSENMLRLRPDYESPLETQSLMGTVVEIIGEEGYWRQIITPEPYTAWCTNLGLVEMTQEQIEEYEAAPKYIFTSEHGRVYDIPSHKGRSISDLSMGNLLRIVYDKGKPSKHKRFVEVMLPDGRTGWTLQADVDKFKGWGDLQDITVDDIIKTALPFEGTPYLWGGASSKGLDCSGLVRLCFYMNGVLLPRNASQQDECGQAVEMECNHAVQAGSEELKAEMLRRTEHLRPGDLVFFGRPATSEKKEAVTHVGIYIGDGKIIHSSHKVRINSLIPGSADYYENSHRLIKARRLI